MTAASALAASEMTTLSDSDLDRVTAGLEITDIIQHPALNENGNVGFLNSGNNNTGIGNVGNRNRGVGNAGIRNVGIGNAGNRNVGTFLRGGSNNGIGTNGFPDDAFEGFFNWNDS